MDKCEDCGCSTKVEEYISLISPGKRKKFCKDCADTYLLLGNFREKQKRD